MAEMFDAIDRCPAPVVARVQGAALGGGMGLCAVSDLVIAEAGAKFGFTETPPRHPAGGHQPVRHRQDRRDQRASAVPGWPALRRHASAAHRPHPRGRRGRRGARPRGGCRRRRHAGGRTDRGAGGQVDHPRGARPAARVDALAHGAQVIARQRVSAEGQEGLRAFLEKRAPAWTRAEEPTRATDRRSTLRVPTCRKRDKRRLTSNATNATVRPMERRSDPVRPRAGSGSSTRTVQRWLREGRLPSVTVGGRLKVAVGVRRASIAQRRSAGTPSEAIGRLLVANRGELVVRIARTCRSSASDPGPGARGPGAAWWTPAADEVVPLRDRLPRLTRCSRRHDGRRRCHPPRLWLPGRERRASPRR